MKVLGAFVEGFFLFLFVSTTHIWFTFLCILSIFSKDCREVRDEILADVAKGWRWLGNAYNHRRRNQAAKEKIKTLVSEYKGTYWNRKATVKGPVTGYTYVVGPYDVKIPGICHLGTYAYPGSKVTRDELVLGILLHLLHNEVMYLSQYCCFPNVEDHSEYTRILNLRTAFHMAQSRPFHYTAELERALSYYRNHPGGSQA